MATISEMINWFQGRFDTAGGNLFHNGAGSYQYPPGFAAVDILVELEMEFPDAASKDRIEAAKNLEDQGPWVDFETFDEEASGAPTGPTVKAYPPCEACGATSRYNILLAKSIHGLSSPAKDYPRYYLPNEGARKWKAAERVWFCATCMRKLEDNLRATIMNLQLDSDRLSAKIA